MNARIVLLPGDGVGPEVIRAAHLVLERVASAFGHHFTFDTRAIGAAALRRGAPPLPDDTIAACIEAGVGFVNAIVVSTLTRVLFLPLSEPRLYRRAVVWTSLIVVLLLPGYWVLIKCVSARATRLAGVNRSSP